MSHSVQYMYLSLSHTHTRTHSLSLSHSLSHSLSLSLSHSHTNTHRTHKHTHTHYVYHTHIRTHTHTQKTEQRRIFAAFSSFVLSALDDALTQCAAWEAAWQMQERKAIEQRAFTALRKSYKDAVSRRASSDCGLRVRVRRRALERWWRAWKQLMTLKLQLSMRGANFLLHQARNRLGMLWSCWIKWHTVRVKASAAAGIKLCDYIACMLSCAVSHWRAAARLLAKHTHVLARLSALRVHRSLAFSLPWWRDWARRIGQKIRLRKAGSRTWMLRQALNAWGAASGSRSRQLRSLVSKRVGQ